MPTFTVRVELHGVSDYSNLHTEMQKEKFKTTITAGDGKEYHLPTAEYNLPDGIDDKRATVLNRAKRAITAALKNESQTIKNKNTPPTVLVTESNGRIWSGLTEV
jgi:hypothetical protein